MTRASRSAVRGFTLIEVLIALFILVTISSAIWRSMALSFETKRRVGIVNDRYHEGRQVLTRISREIRMAFLRTELPVMEEDEAVFVTQFKGEDEELWFASTAHLRLHQGSRESDQTEIHYFLKSSDSRDFRGKTLFRRESRRVDARPERGGHIWPVVDGVKELKFEYWDASSEIGDDAWRRSWDTEGENEDLLPSRVRITLVLEGVDGRPEIRFVTQAAPKIRRPIAAQPVEDQRKRARGVNPEDG